MNPPPGVRFDEDLNLFLWSPKGVINESAMNEIITFLGEKESTSKEPFNRFADMRAVDAMDLDFGYVFQASLSRRLAYSDRPAAKAAILVTDATVAHFSKMHALLTHGSPLNIRVFEKRSEAAKWLGISEQTLENAAKE